MFSSWASKDLPKETRQLIVDVYAGSNLALDALNKTIGIFIVPMHIAYDRYVKAGEIWLRAQVEGYNLRPPLADLSWVQDALYSMFALLALVILVLLIKKVLDSRAAASVYHLAQLRDKRERRCQQ
jgi:hypothetical protein